MTIFSLDLFFSQNDVHATLIAVRQKIQMPIPIKISQAGAHAWCEPNVQRLPQDLPHNDSSAAASNHAQ
jgi:hypothetical protein